MVSTFTKKMIKNMSAEDKAALARSATDPSLIVRLFKDIKIVSVKTALEKNASLGTLPVIEALSDEYTAEYLLSFRNRLTKESMQYLLEQLKSAEGSVYEIFIPFLREVTKHSTLSGFLTFVIDTLFPNAKGQNASWFAEHRALKDFVSGGDGYPSKSRNDLRNLIVLISEDESLASEVCQQVIGNEMRYVLMRPSLLREAILGDCDIFGEMQKDGIGPSHDIWSETSEESIALLYEAWRKEGRPSQKKLFSDIARIKFSFEELLQVTNFHRLIEDFGATNVVEIKRHAMKSSNFASNSVVSSYLSSLDKAGELTISEKIELISSMKKMDLSFFSVTDFGLALEICLQQETSDQGDEAEDRHDDGSHINYRIRSRFLETVKDAAINGRLLNYSAEGREQYYGMLLRFFPKSTALFAHDSAISIAVENFSPEEILEAMRSNKTSRLGFTKTLRKTLKELGRKKGEPSLPSDETDSNEMDSDEMDSDEMDSDEMDSDETPSSIRERANGSLKDASRMKALYDDGHARYVFEALSEDDSPEIGDDLISFLRSEFKEGRAFEEYNEYRHKRMFRTLYRSISAEEISELCRQKITGLVEAIVETFGGEKALSLADVVALGERNFLRYLREPTAEDKEMVLSLCRSSVEAERAIGFAVLSRSIKDFPVKEVSKAILRSHEGNKKLNSFIYEVATSGDVLASNVFLFISYIKELFFDHSSVLAAEFLERISSSKEVSSVFMMNQECVYNFLAAVRSIVNNPDYLLVLLSDKSKQASMYAADLGRAYMNSESRMQIRETIRGAMAGDRVFPKEASYDVFTLAGLHDAIGYIDRKLSETNYQFSSDKMELKTLALYMSERATSSGLALETASGSILTLKLATERHDLLDLGEICGFCIGNSHYSKSAYMGEQVFFSMQNEDGKFVGACTFDMKSQKMVTCLYSKNKPVSADLKLAIARMLESFVDSVEVTQDVEDRHRQLSDEALQEVANETQAFKNSLAG